MEAQLHRVASFLLHPKCLYGIDGGGPPSGNQGRDQTADSEQSADGDNCGWIVPPDSKEECLHGAHGEPGDDETARETEGKQESSWININEAYERLLKSDVKYRFVIDMASLQ